MAAEAAPLARSEVRGRAALALAPGDESPELLFDSGIQRRRLELGAGTVVKLGVLEVATMAERVPKMQTGFRCMPLCR